MLREFGDEWCRNSSVGFGVACRCFPLNVVQRLKLLGRRGCFVVASRAIRVFL